MRRSATRSTSAPTSAVAKNALEQSDINIKYYSNQIKPDVNANVGYNPIGVGGSQLSPVDLVAVAGGASPNRTIIADRGFGSVLGDVFQSQYPTWTLRRHHRLSASVPTPRRPISRAPSWNTSRPRRS